MLTFQIFISFPSDCAEERDVVHEIASRLNVDPFVSSFTRVEIAAWDWEVGVPLEALDAPQESVNSYLVLPEYKAHSSIKSKLN